MKSDIDKSIKKSNYKKSFRLLDTYAIICQGINDHFRDEHVEDVLKGIAKNTIGIETVEPDKTTKAIVFYDQIGTTVCLGLQYLRALKDLGFVIDYIFESPQRKIQKMFLEEVKTLCRSYHIFESPSTVETAKEIQSIIVNTKDSKLITHFSAEGAMAASVLYSIKGIETYRIVPGDHHYHLGIDCYDHYLDYRDFAIKISVEERRVPMNRVHRLTYYPIIDSKVEFKGYPEQTKGKKVVLAAGAEYKFHGSTWFFDFSKWLLNNHSDVVIVFLGGESLQLKQFIAENFLEDKFLLLGYRNDFVECMKHADIFLNSYPMGGGLVGLTAVNLGVPVLSHYDEFNGLQNSIRSFMGAEHIDSPISFIDDEKMKAYASRLIEDNEYRKQEGLRMKTMTQTRERFTQQLGEILFNNGHLVKKVTEKSCNLDKRTESYVTLQNQFQASILHNLYKVYGFYYFFHFPFLICVAYSNKRFVTGFLLGGIAHKIVPESVYRFLKNRFMKHFV